ncbi:MAG: prepilin peptidase [Gemmatimonadetes bacterium]|nr:prepilin peptidase [Gemmatimonadota bacterium]
MSPFIAAFTFAIGSAVGSFLNVCIARWPNDESVVRPRSRCPKCGAGIAWFDNIPIASWLTLRGRCRGCGEPISAIYPTVELTVALLWVASIAVFGASLTGLRVALLATILFGIAVTDLKHYLIPDGFTVSGLVLAAIGAVAGAWIGESGPFAGPVDAILGACVGAGAITIIGWLGEVALKREAMGFGDSTLMAMAGASLGSARALLTIFVAALLAAVVFLLIVYPLGSYRARRRGVPFEAPLVPFGVFLAPAALITLVAGYPMLNWYLDRFLR